MSDTPTNPAPVVQPKPLLPVALKSTEFWLTILVVVILAIETLSGLIPADKAAVFTLATASLYKILRTLLKWRAAGFQFEALLAEIDLTADRRAVATPTTPQNRTGQEAQPETPTAEVAQGAAALPLPQGAEGGFVQPRVLVTALLLTVVALGAIALLSGCASLPPIKGKACYTTKDGQTACISGSSEGIAVEADLHQSTEGFAK